MKAEILNSTDEAYLVKRCKDNNPSAQKALYNKYVAGMMIVCLRYIVNQEEAKEVMMDGFYSFFKSISGFMYMGDGSVKAWLKKIMINQCLMHLRKRQPFFITVENIEQFEDKWVDANVAGEMNTKEILKMVHALPDGYRIVFNLYVFEDKNHREIADILGISENTSKSQLHRARIILKKKILAAK